MSIPYKYKFFYCYNESNTNPILNKFAIWCDDLNVSHLRTTEHLFIDGTWYRPNGFQQIIIILYKDKQIN